MATLTVTLPEPMLEFVEAQARQGGFDTVSDYLGSIIREVQKREAKQALEAKLREGLESPSRPMTAQDWEGLRQKIRERSPELGTP